MITINEKLLTNIKELCKEKGISQRQLQVELNLSAGSISKWRSSNPSYSTLEKVAHYFDVSVDYLKGDSRFRNQDHLLQYFNQNFNPLEEVDIDQSEGIPAYLSREVREIAETIDSKPHLYDLFVLAKDLDVEDVLAVQAVLARFKVKN